MSAPIGPGDWVECIDVTPRNSNGPGNLTWLRLLRVGAIYRVQAVFTLDGEDGFALAGFPPPPSPRMRGFRADRFRPIYRPSESLFLERLMDVPAAPEFEPA